ncbi:sugar isomerase domain-containing protein [Georgenia faecalis]|uniref:Sugar isomerase domain-containing protein n=1 Tax=Georgenia faecalis TaxID=2483799 RepID=A0ABV9D9H9_9MICO|nr:sugar isomerase domain-containing protein [Georgenia faecalis]
MAVNDVEPVLQRFGRSLTDHVDDILRANAVRLTEAAALITSTWRADGLLYAAGSGHSLAAVLETFYRAGGLPFVRPLWARELLPLHGSERSTQAERQPGVGERLVLDAGVGEADTVVVFSTSGVNHVPLEIAVTARESGARVIAVTSVEASDAAPLRAGRRLHQVADLVLDTRVPPGDATWPPDAPRTAPLSSFANVVLWDAILVLVAQAEPAIPFWRSANTTGPSNAQLTQRYKSSVPELR